MNLSGNTIFITGGGSGIGRGLAEALHARGNQVIISGRRRHALDAVLAANPGMAAIELDIQDPGSITAAAQKLTAEHPALNVLINNAGIMAFDNVHQPVDDATASAIVTTNLLGPIRMTSALIDHLKAQPQAYIVNVTSGLGFVPLAGTAVYSATKAALHSYSISQRYQLRDTSVRVLEIAPPYVQTELLGPQQASDPRAMPLEDFIAETVTNLGADNNEVLTQNVLFLRDGVGRNDSEFAFKFNDMMQGGH